MSDKRIIVLPVLSLLALTGCRDIYNSVTQPSSSEITETEITTESVTAQINENASNTTDFNNEQTETVTTTQIIKLPDNLIRGLTHYDQSSGYATACESLAAVSLLRFYDIAIDPGEFITKYLPVADYPVRGADGLLHGESPWEYFIGDPMKSNGYGCYSGAIIKAMEQIAPRRAAVLRDVPLSELCEHYIDNGHPVMIWATIDMKPTREGNTWTLPDGTRFTFIRPEHALILIGYDKSYYFFCDSHRDEEVTAYSKTAVETAYKAMHKQAIVVFNNPLPATEPETAEEPLPDEAVEDEMPVTEEEMQVTEPDS